MDLDTVLALVAIALALCAILFTYLQTREARTIAISVYAALDRIIHLVRDRPIVVWADG